MREHISKLLCFLDAIKLHLKPKGKKMSMKFFLLAAKKLKEAVGLTKDSTSSQAHCPFK